MKEITSERAIIKDLDINLDRLHFLISLKNIIDLRSLTV